MTSATLSVRVQARARHDTVVAVRDGVVVVRVTAPAIEGRANRALCRLLAERLGVPRSTVTVVRGQRSREKVVLIDGIDQPAVEAWLARLGGEE